jgi:hypothetical protein
MNQLKRVALGVSLAVFALGGCGGGDGVLDPDDDAGATGSANNGSSGSGTNGSGTTGNGDSSAGDGGDSTGNANGDSTGTTGGNTPVAADADCDMNGIWIGRQLTQSLALGAPQFSNNWYYLEFAHEGQNVTVTKHYDCGIEVRGTVTVVISKAALEGLLPHNIQTGRKGKMYKEGANCAFEMERFWSIRGGDEQRYAPVPRNSTDSIATVAAASKLPTKANTDGAQDWDMDTKLGTAWQVTGILSGTRNSVQRDWTAWASDATRTVTPAMNWMSDLVVGASFDNEESVIDSSNALLEQLSSADAAAKHTMTLRFLGRDANDSRVKAIVKSTQFDTCIAIQKALAVQTSL